MSISSGSQRELESKSRIVGVMQHLCGSYPIISRICLTSADSGNVSVERLQPTSTTGNGCLRRMPRLQRRARPSEARELCSGESTINFKSFHSYKRKDYLYI